MLVAGSRVAHAQKTGSNRAAIEVWHDVIMMATGAAWSGRAQGAAVARLFHPSPGFSVLTHSQW